MQLATWLLLASQVFRTDFYVPTLKGADFNSTADQAITIPWPRYVVRRIVVDNCSASLTLAAGGFYTGANKTGTTVVASTQLYTALTSTSKHLEVTLASVVNTDILTSPTIFLSLTAGQGTAATCDVRVFADALY